MKKDSPGVYIPPPLLYVITFVVAIYIQKIKPVNDQLFHQSFLKISGYILLALAVLLMFKSVGQFIKNKTSIVTILPANSLQVKGIYHYTRNPMYLSLSIIYVAISCLIGNWWNIILLPVLLFIVQAYVIKKEEKYLERRFGKEYLDYKATVRRWF